MADWDENSPQLKDNLTTLLTGVREDARRRAPLSLSRIKQWHRIMMQGLDVPNPHYVGAFRGEQNIEHVQVFIGKHQGTPPYDVAEHLEVFEQTLTGLLAQLDSAIPTGSELDSGQIQAVISACGWAHAEWVRIHPFANGNGRTARILANAIAMRYGLPPFVRLRPRPDGRTYGIVSEQAMFGDYQPTISLFMTMLNDFLSD